MSPTELFSQHQHKAHIIAHTFSQGLPAWVYLDDLYTAALVGIWEACQTWNPAKATLNTHIKHCTKRSIVDMLRQWYGLCHSYQPQKERMRVWFWPYMGGAIDNRRSPQQDYEDNDEIEAALCRVPKKHRGLLKDYFLLGLTQQEIAHRHNMWPSEVSRILAPYIQRAGTTRNYEKAA